MTRTNAEGRTAGRDSGARDAPAARAVVAVRVHERGEAPLLLPLRSLRSTALIGRFEQADVRLRTDRVSRLHGMLRCDGDDWCYVDLGSANGSFLTTSAEAATDAIAVGRRLNAGEATPLSAVEAVILGSRACWLEVMTELPPGPSTSTRSPAGRRFEEQLAQAAPSRRPVFLLGASGTGKTWAARRLHARGGFAGAFVPLNCARLPNDPVTLRAQLLGHARGAYTSAERAVTGAFFAADGGTLFLDEVESLPPTAQGFLLDVLEGSGDYAPLGVAAQDAPPPPRFRLVSASKQPLRASPLRADLAWRLADGELIRVPGLNDRREDIPGLIAACLADARADGSLAGDVVVAPDALDRLAQARWPGEVRALRATALTVAEAVLRAGRSVMSAADVDARLRAVEDAFGAADEAPGEVGDADRTGRFAARATVHDGAPVAPGRGSRAPGVGPAGVNPRRLDAATVRVALEATAGNIEHAAWHLGISRRTLMKKMDEFGVPRARR